MKKRLLSCFVVTLLVVALFVMPTVGLADAGNFSSNADWGGSDWGGSDWGSDWGSDYGDSGSGIFIFGGGGGGGSFGWFIAAIVIVAVVLSVIKSAGRKSSRGQGSAPSQQNMHAQYAAQQAVMNSSLGELKEKDKNFSEEAIKEKIANLYMEMQNAWQNKAWEPMRAHMTDNLYNQMKRQLDELIKNKRTNYMERIAVLGVDLAGFGRDDTNDIIQAIVKVRVTDYTLDDFTGNLVNGDRTKEKYITYKWTLIRSQGVLTPETTEKVAQHCTSCGAPIDLNHSAKCEYCGTVVTSSEYDWVLSAIAGISQRTA